MKTALLSLIASCVLLVCAGCGTSDSSCAVNGLTISPTSATADHAAAAPGNTAKFIPVEKMPSGCVSTAVIRYDVTWSVSDTTHASISNAHDDTYGTATCTGAAPVPITVSATMTSTAGQSLSATATLTCQ